MNDTPEHVERRYRELLLKLTPLRRLQMASEMFSAARILMREGIRMECGSLDEGELRVQMFVRLYGDDFDPERRQRIIDRIRGSHNLPVPGRSAGR